MSSYGITRPYYKWMAQPVNDLVFLWSRVTDEIHLSLQALILSQVWKKTRRTYFLIIEKIRNKALVSPTPGPWCYFHEFIDHILYLIISLFWCGNLSPTSCNAIYYGFREPKGLKEPVVSSFEADRKQRDYWCPLVSNEPVNPTNPSLTWMRGLGSVITCPILCGM